jgi:catalase
MRLTPDIIHQILIAHNKGESRSVIAHKFSVDAATVTYHIEKFENTYGSTEAVYALIRPVQRACTHPSMKCLICGQAQDHIHRRELQTIRNLTTALAAANLKLEEMGFEPLKPTEV